MSTGNGSEQVGVGGLPSDFKNQEIRLRLLLLGVSVSEMERLVAKSADALFVLKSGFRKYIVDWTPELGAAALAKRPSTQRPINTGKVERYTAEQGTGEWADGAHSMSFDWETGEQLDGQHRSQGQQATGFMFEKLTVVFGDRYALASTVDVPGVRTSEQHGKIIYGGEWPKAKVLASIKTEANNFDERQVSRKEEIALVRSLPADVLAIASHLGGMSATGIINRGSIGAAIRCARTRPDEANKFFTALFRREPNIDGAYCPQAAALLKSIGEVGRKGKLDPREVAVKCIRAFNDFIQGQSNKSRYTYIPSTTIPKVA